MHKSSAKNALILVAAGRGARAGGDVPKQYRVVAGQPLIAHTLQNLMMAFDFNNIVVVVAEGNARITGILEELDQSQASRGRSIFTGKVKTVTGGATRTDSVRNGLLSLEGADIDNVYIHDAARPFVTPVMLSELDRALQTHQAAVPAIPIADALKRTDGTSVNRDDYVRAQTPQAFSYADIMKAFKALTSGDSFADDIAVAKHAGFTIAFTQGHEDNFKVTFPQDFDKAERMLEHESYTATGSGFDVHRTEPGDSLWLCGVEIKAGFSLKGHSDADVGLHALVDAILGAMADGDIGDHFPPEDAQWKGAASDKFLKFATDRVSERGGHIDHVDITLICERPEVKPHRTAMRARIAQILNLPETRVSVKATTTEKLGFTGRGEGIAAQATATLTLPE